MLNSLFNRPSPAVAATQELLEAQLALLQAQSGLEYARAMVDYQQARVNRLEAVLAKWQGADK